MRYSGPTEAFPFFSAARPPSRAVSFNSHRLAPRPAREQEAAPGQQAAKRQPAFRFGQERDNPRASFRRTKRFVRCLQGLRLGADGEGEIWKKKGFEAGKFFQRGKSS